MDENNDIRGNRTIITNTIPLIFKFDNRDNFVLTKRIILKSKVLES